MSPTHSEELVLRMTTRGGETVVLDLNRVANSLGAIQAKSAAVIATAQRMTNIVGIAAGTLTALFGGFAIAATKAWGALEEGSLRLESFIGDAEKARKAYTALLDYAAETPFRLDEEILPGANALLQFDMAAVDTAQDLEVLTDRLNILLTAARGSRRDIYGVVATLNELRQGLWARQELAPLGITSAKLQALGVQMKKGGIGVLEGQGEAAYTAALKILEDKWRIFAERQDSLITNRFKKIGDRLRVVLREAGEPLSEVVMPFIERILTKITKLRDRMREIYADPEAREKFKQAFQPLADMMTSITDKLGELATWATTDGKAFGDELQRWVTIGKNLLIIWASAQFTIWIANVGRATVAIVLATVKTIAWATALFTVGTAANAAWLSIGGPITLLVAGLATIVVSVKGIADQLQRIKDLGDQDVFDPLIGLLQEENAAKRELATRNQWSAEFEKEYDKAITELYNKRLEELQAEWGVTRKGEMPTIVPWSDPMMRSMDKEAFDRAMKAGAGVEKLGKVGNEAMIKASIDLLGTNVLRKGPGGKDVGDNVCASALSLVIIGAGFPIKGSAWIPELRQQLIDLGAEKIKASEALAGDVVFSRGGKHAGTFMGDGLMHGEPGKRKNGAYQEQPVEGPAEYWRLPGATKVTEYSADAAKTAEEIANKRFEFSRKLLQLELLKAEYDDDAVAAVRLQIAALDEEIEYAKELNDAEAVLLDLHIQKAELLKNARGAVQDRIDKENQELQDLNEEHTAQAQKELDGLRMRWAKEDETLRMKQEHELRMAELADIEWDETKSLELQLKQVQEQAAILRQRRTEREAQLAMGGAHIWDIISDADLAQITEALKVLGLVGEELAAAIARIAELAQKTLEEKWRAAGEAFGRAIASGAIGTAIDQSFTILQNIIAARIAKMTAGGAFGEGLGGQFLGGLVGGLAGGIIGFAATALGKVFKKGKKGGMLVEQADTWVMRAEDPNKIRALPSSYFYSGRAMGNLPTFSKSTSFFEQTIGGQAEAQVVGLIQQQKRRGRNWI